MGFNIDELNATFGEYFMSLGEYNGKHYGIPTNINLKSMVWYPKDDFDKAGYTVPKTWDEMLALSRPDRGRRRHAVVRRVRERGRDRVGRRPTGSKTSCCAPPGLDTYDKWATHEIPFNDPAVQNAAEMFGERHVPRRATCSVARDRHPTIAFGDAPLPMFENPPGCWLHRQASFINAFFPEDGEGRASTTTGSRFPPIDQDGTLFAGELAVVGTNGNRPEVKDFLDAVHGRATSSARWAASSRRRGSRRTSTSGPDCYANHDPRRRVGGPDGRR